MDSDEGYNYEFDDEEECSEDSAEEELEDDTLELGEVELVDPAEAGGERDVCGETGSSGLGPGQDEEDYRFEVLTADQILQHMVECIREVNEVIQNPATITRILLSHFNWDKEKLMERYFDGNLEKLFSECHVVNPSKKSRTRQMNTRSSAQDLPCQICYLNYPNAYFTGLECGHKFCMQCWSEYLTTKIIEEGMGQTISCPAHSCDILVDDNTVMRLITDSKVKLKYQHLITNSFVECNRLLKWCPAPDCHHVVKVQYPDAKPVRCKCGRQFCFNCGENWHDPVKCKWLRKWIKKCDDDSETSNWIAANTKECPKCHVTIEKDGGCNHMVCRNQNCKAEFCWVCLGPWEPHGSAWYNCNRYNEDDAKAARDAQEVKSGTGDGGLAKRSRAALQRYLFYCNRYMNHMQSLRFEHKLYAQVKQKMEEMQQHNMSWIEVQFLKKAVDVLCQCRATLMFTYVFAFYLKKNNQSIIFENNQADLENATEVLSGYLERDISQDSLQDIKQKVQDKYRYCESRRRVLLQHVHEGYEKDLWEYIED
ncbi:E3 ubiquitin-protein ligase arih1 isoform X1 [Polyodon spathula]|uniref:E3 ubiquitin-protein ligase arih1 isoform X1 n=1 Tax=Polyodon spathula TaxID=7913 RepID=UPI00145B1DF9|nr:E3 ubiquitin-protein ligase arih1 isoform X1 [Polyodon spathula]XP_041082292.1 E3 ubiquitin-protein ligase arih1 isoform X1 [Polyodon spathula]XP_058854509.1 E3 ubiquitin-protein ligase arih1-like isoform X1 [Acipenser ruthenus]